MNQKYQGIEKLLTQKMGLGSGKIGSRQLTKAIECRQKACGLDNLSDYLKRLQSSAQEFQELVEQVVVPETWFFRHRNAFFCLQDYVKNQWLPTHPQETLRILSIPCSTGEEPYSIAMTLLNSPLTSKQFMVEGIDISKKALAKARKGVYSKNSFRSHDRVENQQFFEVRQNYYQICESIRQQVKFRTKNILSPWLPTHPPYHVIFCRHLLIYLDGVARNRVLTTLEQLLDNGGLLFVGAAESNLVKSPSFRFMNYPSAFAYQKVLEPSPHRLPPVKPSPLIKRQKKQPLSLAKPEKKQLSSLEIAQQFANQGQLKEAAQSCQNYLQRNPIDAAGYLLWGEICQAQGDNEQAQRYFQKALYLRPNYREALVHLALLREHQGDAKGAAVLKNRIQRLDNL
ncbi:MAG: CheR family methyltransferase [Crocosphaera sp.]|nr:CheR family methyltransferase [Crocosphaera sp.]